MLDLLTQALILRPQLFVFSVPVHMSTLTDQLPKRNGIAHLNSAEWETAESEGGKPSDFPPSLSAVSRSASDIFAHKAYAGQDQSHNGYGQHTQRISHRQAI